MSKRGHAISLVLAGGLITGLLGACSNADTSLRDGSQRMVYGADDFRDSGALSQSDPWYSRIRATSSLIRSRFIACDESAGTCAIESEPYTEGEVAAGRFEPLCEGERFFGQPQVSFCTAFLIAPDLVAAAGHCVDTNTDCSTSRFVFGFTAQPGETSEVSTTVPMSDVYSCAEIVARRFQSGGSLDDLDFEVLRLNRPVLDRVPLELREDGAVALGDPVGVAGGYLGLPLKYAGNATVKGIEGTARFEADLDTGPGASGGPVFNLNSGRVEGILVSGGVLSHKVETTPEGESCARTYPCDEVGGCFADPEDDHRDWVKVSRIDEVVKVLENRSCYDNLRNGEETDVDCGGPECVPCYSGFDCLEDRDCRRTGNSCRVAYCDAATGTCQNNTEGCECDEDSDCVDDVECTRDYCSGNVCWNTATDTCGCRNEFECDDGDPCTENVCNAQKECEFVERPSCFPCESDQDCGGPGTPACIVPECHRNGYCDNDSSACECETSADCDDGDECTQDMCFVRTRACIHIPGECRSPCSPDTAIDLGAPGQFKTVQNDACLKVEDGLPSWWGSQRDLLLQSGWSGTYPASFAWSSECTQNSGAGSLSSNWDMERLSDTSNACPTLIQLGGDGSGQLMLSYYGG